MNNKLIRLVNETEQLEAMLKAFEETYLNVESGDYTAECRREAMFYAIWDTAKRIGDRVEDLVEDSQVVDVIHAVKNRSLKKE